MSQDSTASTPWPPPTDSTFQPHAKVHINAPASLVYELLTSPSTWPDWNPFVPSAHLLSRRTADGQDEPFIYDSSTSATIGDAKYKTTPPMRVGDVLRFNVEMPSGGRAPGAKRSKSETDQVITELTEPTEPEGVQQGGVDGGESNEVVTGKGTAYRAVWATVEKMSRPKTVRTNVVEVLGDAECEYRSWEEFRGLLAYAVKYAVGKTVQLGFDEWADELKAEAEKRWKAQTAQGQ